MKGILHLLLCAFALSLSCSNPSENASGDKPAPETSDHSSEPLEIDVAVSENEVRIGDQTWMRRNLDAKQFRNGDPVDYAQDNPAWKEIGDQAKPVMGYVLNNEENAEKYGAIYNWYAIADERGLCPEGWRVPTNDEWLSLIEYLGGSEKAGYYLKDSLMWGAGGSGNNLSGFAALPGGFRGYDGLSYSAEYMGRWWTSTEHSEYFAFGWDINYDNDGIGSSTGYKQDGFSLRCIKE